MQFSCFSASMSDYNFLLDQALSRMSNLN
uniref:Uncharacterized protein n=1 Tax=Rhizophora mucronata TaxID=61149 RepID=A0A2P2KJY9_RHIMU